MNIWRILIANDESFFLKSERMTMHLYSDVRRFFEQSELAIPVSIIHPPGTVAAEITDIQDFGTLNTVPVLSERAVRFCIELGQDDSDFFELNVDSVSDTYFAFYPHRLFDVVDSDLSSFHNERREVFPVMRTHIKKLFVKQISEQVPPLFRSAIAGWPERLHGECFATDEFQHGWRSNGFTGASFRLLTDDVETRSR